VENRWWTETWALSKIFKIVIWYIQGEPYGHIPLLLDHCNSEAASKHNQESTFRHFEVVVGWSLIRLFMTLVQTCLSEIHLFHFSKFWFWRAAKNATTPRFRQQSTIRPISFSFEINSRLLGNL
jgi:hypothetical protein